MSNMKGISFFQMLWPSQNIWTLQEQFHVQNPQKLPLFSLIEEIMPQSHEEIPVTFYGSLL